MEQTESNFVKGLKMDHNRTLTYLTLIFILGFLACLLAFWVYSYREAVCANCLGGQTCCYTHLENTAIDGDEIGAVLTQASSTPTQFENGQVINLEYASKDGSPETFFLQLYNQYGAAGSKLATNQFTCYPTEHNSGFSVTDTGVSVVLDHYFNNPNDWPDSYKVIYAGLSAFSNRGSTIQSGYLEVKLGDGDIEYISSQGTKGHPLRITTTTNPSYFRELNEATKGNQDKEGVIVLSNKISNPGSYNPMHNFIDAKAKVKNSNNCTDIGVCCQCVDPSSKNLPSCSNPYHQGLGYVTGVDSNTGATIYSKNCSYTYSRFHGSSTSTANNPMANISRLVAAGSGLSKAISASSASTLEPPDSKGVRTTFNSQAVPQNTDPTNAYNSQKLFCGGNNVITANTPTTFSNPMYPSNFTTKPGAEGTSTVRTSTLPNAQAAGGGKVVLGNN